MKRLLIVLVLGLTMFGASAALSMYLRRAEVALTEKDAAADSDGAPHGDKIGKGPSSNPDPKAKGLELPPLTSTRPAPPSAESVAQLAEALRQQQESLRAREQQFQVRQKHLEIIYTDMRTERTALDDLRQQVNGEMKALTDKLDALERKSGDVDKQKLKLLEQNKELKQTLFEVDNVEQKSFKRMAATFDAMDADTASDLLQQMADSGKMDMAVKILGTMQERQAARVLGQMPDKGAAVQILDRMKGLRRTGGI